MIFAARSASMMMFTELGSPRPSSLYSRLKRDVAELRPSRRTNAHLRSSEPRDVSPTGRCAHTAEDRSFPCNWLVTDCVFEIFFDSRRCAQHVHEVHVVADVELVRAIDGHAAIFEQLLRARGG